MLVLVALAVGSGGAWAADANALFATKLTATDDGELSLADYQGKPLIVNFWARWCAPCRTELPELAKLHDEYGAQGLQVVGIAVEDNTPAVREFLAAYGVHYPVGLGQKKGIWLMQGLGNTSALLPFTLAIDRKGEIVMQKLGAFKQADFDQIADRLLN
ncbi:MAG: TlpA family protein disulfide reductase [Gammaproteobacteria bacterium]|nr:TlpA family protein disulfide reductase [Gammaproteobacteria bacterium]